jgi:hypothetical protein
MVSGVEGKKSIAASTRSTDKPARPRSMGGRTHGSPPEVTGTAKLDLDAIENVAGSLP